MTDRRYRRDTALTFYTLGLLAGIIAAILAGACHTAHKPPTPTTEWTTHQ